MTPDCIVKRNDTFPPILSTVSDDADAPVDVSGATVTFRMVRDTGAVVIEAGEVTIISAANGQIGYQWASGDTAVPGWYRAEFRITFPSGRTMKAPNGDFLHILIVESA